METSQEVRLSFSLTLWDRIRAAFVLAPERKLSIVFWSIWPLIGIWFVSFLLLNDKPFNIQAWVAIALCFLFMPIIVVVNAIAAQYFNKQAREPFTYTFNSTGIHVSAVTYEYTHKWPTVYKVKRAGGFLLFFFSPGCAHCIPFQAAKDAGIVAPLVALAAENGALADGI